MTSDLKREKLVRKIDRQKYLELVKAYEKVKKNKGTANDILIVDQLLAAFHNIYKNNPLVTK